MGWSADINLKINEIIQKLGDLSLNHVNTLLYCYIHIEGFNVHALSRIEEIRNIMKGYINSQYIDGNFEKIISDFEKLKIELRNNEIQQNLDELISLTKHLQKMISAHTAAEAKAQEKFLLSDDILKDVFSMQGNASNPIHPQQAPTQIQHTIDDRKKEITYTSNTNSGKVITHNYDNNSIKAEGFDDNLKALLTTLKTLAESRKNLENTDPLLNPPPLLTFKITEPKTLSTEKLNKLLDEIGYKEEHKGLVKIILSDELAAKNDPHPANQAAQQADSSSGLTFTTARTNRNQHSVQQENESHTGFHNDGVRFP